MGGLMLKWILDRGWDGMDWIGLTQDSDQWRALVNIVMNLWVPLNVGKFLSSCITGSFSRSAQLHGVSYVSTLIATMIFLYFLSQAKS
jgi:hypothetical protein